MRSLINSSFLLKGCLHCPNQGLDSLANDPRLDFRLNRSGDTGDGVGGDSASEERLEAMVAVGFLEGLDEGLEVGEVLGEGGEVRVFGEGVSKLLPWPWGWFGHH